MPVRKAVVPDKMGWHQVVQMSAQAESVAAVAQPSQCEWVTPLQSAPLQLQSPDMQQKPQPLWKLRELETQMAPLVSSTVQAAGGDYHTFLRRAMLGPKARPFVPYASVDSSRDNNFALPSGLVRPSGSA